MTNTVSGPPFVSPASNITSYIDQNILMQVLFKPSASSYSLSVSSTSASDDLPDGTELPSEIVGSRDTATSSSSPSLPPQSHFHHEIPSPVHTSPPVELSDRIQAPPEIINSRDAAASPSPSLPHRSSSHPQIPLTSASTPVLTSPPKPFWKRFPMFNRSAASVDSKWWKFPRISNIMQRKHQNVELQAGPNDA
ncbi:hypothetical protein C8R48DRAFT_679682 [Suillus tomentosus]|nr:hypothetical protein C8R48DRAFT_679682 [Suillus tomentosus]